MMTGTITNKRAHLERPVRGAGGQGMVEFTVDTGYTAYLTLPPSYCEALQLPFVRDEEAYMANGSLVWTEIYSVLLDWDGEERAVEVIAVESEPLIGMTLLDGYDLLMEVRENGVVRIQKSQHREVSPNDNATV